MPPNIFQALALLEAQGGRGRTALGSQISEERQTEAVEIEHILNLIEQDRKRVEGEFAKRGQRFEQKSAQGRVLGGGILGGIGTGIGTAIGGPVGGLLLGGLLGGIGSLFGQKKAVASSPQASRRITAKTIDQFPAIPIGRFDVAEGKSRQQQLGRELPDFKLSEELFQDFKKNSFLGNSLQDTFTIFNLLKLFQGLPSSPEGQATEGFDFG